MDVSLLRGIGEAAGFFSEDEGVEALPLSFNSCILCVPCVGG